MEWAIFGSAFTLIFLLIVILGEHLRQKRKIKLREIIQTERIAAMERGVPMPEIDDEVFMEEKTVIHGPEQYKHKMQWLRITLLSIGLFLSFGGLGMFLGFHFSGDFEFVKMATIGFIPFLAGIGLLLFYYLTNKEVV